MKILTTFGFLSGLAVLLLNDFVFKGIYGNWLTGKLSDFAGLFIFPLFWFSFFPKHKSKIFFFTGLLFIWWKSSYSQSFIDIWNTSGVLPISRIVDYSDLIALFVLPLAYNYEKQQKQVKSLPIPHIYPLLVAAFAFMATSYKSQATIGKTYLLEIPKSTLVNKLAKIDSLNSGYGVKFSDRNPDTINFRLPSKFCFDSFEVTVSVAELSNGKTLLTLLNANYSCPEEDEDKDELTKEFERVIINKIKNAP